MSAVLLASHMSQWLTIHGLLTAFAVLVYVVTSHVMQQRRQPAVAIAWMLFLVLLPYVALPAYVMFGSRKRKHALAPTPRREGPRDPGHWAVDTILALGQPLPAAYRDLTVHADGREAREALFATIESARESIDICTFILARDTIGEAVIAKLCEKARGGVRVRLLLDGMGSLMVRRPSLAALRQAGGVCSLFVPPLRLLSTRRANLRDHRKLCVVDAGLASARLWCGGRNLAAEYFEGRPGEAPWHDLTFDVRGSLVQQAHALFERDWAFVHGVAADAPVSTTSFSGGAQLVASGPDQADDTVYALLLTASYRACRRIALVTPYFVPEPALSTALCLAARRGVAVDLVLPARSNHGLSDVARERSLRTLVQSGGRVWLVPGMLHAKLVVIDDTLALAGSANLDSRSFFLNYELMVAFHDAHDVGRFAQWFEGERARGRAYVPEPPGLLRDIAEGMLLWVGFQL